MNTVVEAQSLIRRYGDFSAVDGIDFAIPQGVCFGFLGPNGAGKTTTMKMIQGFTPKTSGQLRVFGEAMPERAPEVRSRLGLVPQNDNLDPDFNVEENLLSYGSYFGIKRAEMRERCRQLLEFANLQEWRKARIDTLSGGMRRRLIIARALVNHPEMVVLDEPTTALDPQARHVIWGRLAELKAQGKTLILTTHYMEEAERLCDALVIMDQGRILAYGSPQQLIQEHLEAQVIECRAISPEQQQFLAQLPGCRMELHAGSAYLYSNDSDAALAQLQQNMDIRYILRPTGLEDVFLKLTGRELRD